MRMKVEIQSASDSLPDSFPKRERERILALL